MRNVILLSLSQALAMSGTALLVFVGGIIGAYLSPTNTLATMPLSLSVVGLAFSTIPAAVLMRKIGRRKGFMLGSLLAGSASLLAMVALQKGDFILFCVSAFLIGSNRAFVQQYRFAAAESVQIEQTGRAVSLVLVGGIFAGFLGPEIALLTKDIVAGEEFSGSFATMALIYGLVIFLMFFLRGGASRQDHTSLDGRPIRKIVLQPVYIVAVMAGALSFGVMSFIMTATPLQMHMGHGFTLDDTGWVIQSHIIAMYIPSLFTGYLVERLGVVKIIAAGVFFMLSTVSIAIINQELLGYWWALVLLGLGWNLLFVSGTVLLTRSYLPSERYKAQAVNDFIIFGITAFTSLAAGTVLFITNWETLLLLNLPPIALMLAALYLLRSKILQPSV